MGKYGLANWLTRLIWLEMADIRIADDSKRELFIKQKILLDTFLEHGAISQEQYNKSLGDLREKMGIEE